MGGGLLVGGGGGGRAGGGSGTGRCPLRIGVLLAVVLPVVGGFFWDSSSRSSLKHMYSGLEKARSLGVRLSAS